MLLAAPIMGTGDHGRSVARAVASASVAARRHARRRLRLCARDDGAVRAALPRHVSGARRRAEHQPGERHCFGSCGKSDLLAAILGFQRLRFDREPPAHGASFVAILRDRVVLVMAALAVDRPVCPPTFETGTGRRSSRSFMAPVIFALRRRRSVRRRRNAERARCLDCVRRVAVISTCISRSSGSARFTLGWYASRYGLAVAP